MSAPYGDDQSLTTPQTAPALDDNALTTPHDPTMDMGRTTPIAPTDPSAPLPVSVWPMTSPYIPDGTSVPPPPPLRARRGPLRAGLTLVSIIAVLALVAGIAYAASHRGAGVAGVNDSAATAAKSYCTALQGAQYARAYTFWDAALTGSLNADTYAAISKDVDAQSGAVTACVPGKATTTGSTATIPVTLTRGTAGAQSLIWHFSKGNNGWRLSQYPDASLAARATLRSYCAAVVGGQYSTAFALFSSALQQKLGSADAYAAVAGEVDAASGKATACATSSVDMGSDGTATGHLTLTRNGSDTESMTLSAATTGTASFTTAPDVSLPSRITARAFCAALVKKDYNAAYAQFTPSAQQAIGSSSDFGNRVGAATTILGDITGCQAGGFALHGDGQSGTLSGQVKTHAIYGDNTHNTVLSMIASDPNTWLIDDATIDGVSLSSGGGFPFFGGDGDVFRPASVSKLIWTPNGRGICSNHISARAKHGKRPTPAASCRMESSHP